MGGFTLSGQRSDPQLSGGPLGPCPASPCPDFVSYYIPTQANAPTAEAQPGPECYLTTYIPEPGFGSQHLIVLLTLELCLLLPALRQPKGHCHRPAPDASCLQTK